MKVIGLCGGSGAGKGFIGALLEIRGIPVVDTDAVYHTLIAAPSDCTRELTELFGAGILTEDGAIDRRALGAIVFRDSDAMEKLNAVSHRHILSEVRRRLAVYAAEGIAAAAVDAPLLFESGYDRECDFVIAVTAPETDRVKRIISRDGISENAAKQRIAAQLPDDELARRSKYTVVNGYKTDPTVQIDKILAAEGLL